MTFRAWCCLVHHCQFTAVHILNTVLTLCVSIHVLRTKHLTLLWVGPVKCHLISLCTPHQFFSVSVWPQCKGWNTTYTPSHMVILVNDPQAAVTWRSWYGLDWVSSSSMRGWVVAAVKEQFRDLRAENPGFGRLRQSRRFGPGPELGSIDTHLQFLCTPTHTLPPLRTVGYIHACILHSAVFFARTLLKHPLLCPLSISLSTLCFTLNRLLPCSYLYTVLSDLILCNATLLDLWC